MKIQTENLGKRFNLNWIFRKFNLNFMPNSSYAITGANGSGKSTFLQVLTGVIPSSEGKIEYLVDEKLIHGDDVFKYFSYSAPYLELIEEFTLLEQLQFHFKFKPLLEASSIAQVAEKIGLEKVVNREISYFSSGMKQRVKLALSLFSDTPVLVLDEPTSNLDKQGIQWYRNEILKQHEKRMIIIASNQENEYDFCKEKIRISEDI